MDTQHANAMMKCFGCFLGGRPYLLRRWLVVFLNGQPQALAFTLSKRSSIVLDPSKFGKRKVYTKRPLSNIVSTTLPALPMAISRSLQHQTTTFNCTLFPSLHVANCLLNDQFIRNTNREGLEKVLPGFRLRGSAFRGKSVQPWDPEPGSQSVRNARRLHVLRNNIATVRG